MKYRVYDGKLHLDPGRYCADYELVISDIGGWQLVSEENGVVFLEFQLPEGTQHVSVVESDADALFSVLKGIEKEIGKPLMVNASDKAISSNSTEGLLPCIVTVDLIAGIIASSMS
ncbi:MAG: hypothetical protein GY746_13810 [Gammaproteobacteria bacterium]|nr:hypothetical protein [Gammaproteobacteria bacterium]